MMEKNCKQRRPCPFCGGNDYHVEYCDRTDRHHIVCENCGVEGPIVKRDELLSTWNMAKRRKYDRP